jgi:hypothetical protein
MIHAGEAVRTALRARLCARRELAGLEGLRADIAPNGLPRISIDPGDLADWSTKDLRGREVRTLVSVRVARGQALRLPSMAAAIEAAGEALSGDIGGWRVASAVLMQTRTVDQADGTRVTQVAHRVRVLEADQLQI